MEIRLIAVGTKMPQWINQGFHEYAKRMPPECKLLLQEISAGKRTKGADIVRLTRIEGEQISAAIPKGSRTVALEVKGKMWSTEQLADRMQCWMEEGRDVALIIGGPEGIEKTVSDAADEKWSISSLTLPHPLVRVILAEQIYRAWSILRGHPYHR
jgi:23S rRNA (pseudouridine1915-N3)-methyltransferase